MNVVRTLTSRSSPNAMTHTLEKAGTNIVHSCDGISTHRWKRYRTNIILAIFWIGVLATGYSCVHCSEKSCCPRLSCAQAGELASHVSMLHPIFACIVSILYQL